MVLIARPCTGRPSKGEFLDFERKSSSAICQGRSRSKTTKSAGAPIASRPTGRRRISAGGPRKGPKQPFNGGGTFWVKPVDKGRKISSPLIALSPGGEGKRPYI